MCMCVTLSASVTLVFLFMPKLYIIVLRPDRNNRAFFTTSKSIRCHIGARVAAAIAEPTPKHAVYRISESEETESSSGNCVLFLLIVETLHRKSFEIRIRECIILIYAQVSLN